MSGATLAAAGAVHLVTAAVFLAVGTRLWRREVAEPFRLAHHAFVAWWWGFAAYLTGQGALDLAAAAGSVSLAPHALFRLVSGPLLAGAAGGLAFHIVYLWSGSARWAVPLAFYYGAAGALYSMLIWVHEPVAVRVTPWSADLEYRVAMEGPLWEGVLASIGLPLVLGSLAYLGLAFRVNDREKRYRILLVSTSLLLWVVSGYAGQVGGGALVRFVTIVLLGLVTAGATLAAYFPPARVRRWLALPAGG